MVTPVIMPRQGQSVESCIISNWAKKVGEKVSIGDILFTYETDKATFDEESKVEGTLLTIFFQEGDDVPCLTNVCVIGNEGEAYNEFSPVNATQPAPVQQLVKQAAVPVVEAVQKTVVNTSIPKSNANPVIMPRQGQSVESCIISNWAKKVGDNVSVGDILFTYETDKATFDEESKFDGTMLAIFFKEGDDVPCLTNVCVIGKQGEGFEEFNPNNSTEETQNTQTEVIASAQPVISTTVAASSVNLDGRLMISPRAKVLATKAGVNPKFAIGNGPYGRIVENDIRNLIANGPSATFAASSYAEKDLANTGIGGKISVNDLNSPAQKAPESQQSVPVSTSLVTTAIEAEYEDVKLPNIRKFIAKSMQQSLSTMAQLTLNASFDATNILAFRKQLKDGKDRLGLENITINDIIIYAVSRTIENHKDINAHFLDDKMRYFKNVNIGVAVDTARGLMVPTLLNANLKSLNSISKESKKLAVDAQNGTISPDLLKGGTFTITNLGTLGIESFTPVINPPQTAILGVNTLVTRVREVNGILSTYSSMPLSLTFDHRALDGAPAAKFLQDLIKNLEDFTLLLSK